MNQFRISLLVIIAVSLFIGGCCTSEKGITQEGSKTVDIKSNDSTVVIKNVEAWVDLMPGGPAGFMFAGEALITLGKNVGFNDLKCQEAIIYENNKEIKRFPFRIEQIENKSYKPGKSDYFLVRFSSRERNSAEGLVKNNYKITIEIVFRYEDKEISGISEPIEIKRTY
jgi:hypothetical protein